MLNSTVLEVVIGMVFCYASVALIASTVYEGIASFMKTRARTLLGGVKDLLNDPDFNGLAKDVYNHALVNPRDSGASGPGKTPTKLPSYIEANHFAQALVDVIQKAPGTAEELKAKIDAMAEGQLKRMLLGMWARAEGKVEHLTVQLAAWFDDGMDRVAGSYKRGAQLYTFLIAFVLTVLFNIDSIHLFRTLWGHPALAAQLANPAAAESMGETLAALQVLPIGWDNCPMTVAGTFGMFGGWLVTASSALFGAPFWFDLLKRLINVRGAGRSPDRKNKGVASASR
jgi:hypothetical protein